MISQTKRIILLLDESGSMFSQKNDVITGVNEMIRSQRELQESSIEFSIIKFNTNVTKIRSDMLQNVKPFSGRDYSPSGGTALYDAIGMTINKYSNDVGTIMIVVTDGMENSSREYNRKQMIDMINHQRLTKNWNFIYLSEDPTTVKQGESIGINNSVKQCSNTFVGHQQCGKVIGSSSLQNFIKDVSSGKTTQNYDEYCSAGNFAKVNKKNDQGWENFNTFNNLQTSKYATPFSYTSNSKPNYF